MQHQPPKCNVASELTGALIGGAAIGADATQPEAIFRHASRDARIDDVDDTAQRRRTEQQRAWPPQNLDPVGEQRIDRHRMIDRGVRHVDRANTVSQHPDAFTLLAAQHWT